LLTGERPAGTECPSEINPQSPKYLDGVFKKAYTRLDKRFTSADEFLKALSAAAPPPLSKPAGPPPLFAGRSPTHPGPTHPGPSPVNPPTIPGTHPGDPGGFFTPIVDGGRLVCQKCRQTVEKTDQFCMHCGVRLAPVIRRCKKCGSYPDGHDRFCIFCGETLATV
jgi:hypothetical protein